MPRRRRHSKRYRADEMSLAIGAVDVTWKHLTPREHAQRMRSIEAQWADEGEAMVDEYRHDTPGHRPWAWWEFDAHENMPPLDEQLARLLDLDALDTEEIQAVIDEADKLIADQFAGKIQYPQAPPPVLNGNLARRHLGLPEVETDGFADLHDWRADLDAGS